MITWIDVLGRDTTDVHVDGCYIVRGWEQCKVLWKFDSPEDAEINFQEWLRLINEDRQPPVGSWAAVARMMAASDDSGYDWDAWKDEMKERE